MHYWYKLLFTICHFCCLRTFWMAPYFCLINAKCFIFSQTRDCINYLFLKIVGWKRLQEEYVFKSITQGYSKRDYFVRVYSNSINRRKCLVARNIFMFLCVYFICNTTTYEIITFPTSYIFKNFSKIRHFFKNCLKLSEVKFTSKV